MGPIGRVVQREHCSALVALEAGHFLACGTIPDDCPAVITGSRELAPVRGPIHGQDVVEKDVDIQQLCPCFNVPDLRSAVESHAGEIMPLRRKSYISDRSEMGSVSRFRKGVPADQLPAGLG